MKKTISNKLLAVWSVIFALTCIAFSILKIALSLHHGYVPDAVLEPYHIAVTAVVSVFFFHMLFVICHFAKKEGNKSILNATRVLLGIVSIWMVLNCISIIRELINC